MFPNITMHRWPAGWRHRFTLCMLRGSYVSPFSRSLARPEKAIRSGTQLYMYGCNSSSLPCPPPSGAASHIFTICRRMTERDGERRNATQRHNGPRRNVPLATTGTGTRDGSQLSEPLQSPAWRRFTWAHVAPDSGVECHYKRTEI